MASPDRELDGLLLLALRAARLAAAEILEVYAGAFAVESKADSTPITEADRRANRAIEAVLREHSSHPILSEEGAAVPYETRRSWQRFWLVDPLDGTKEFVRRNGEFAVNVALVEAAAAGGVPVLGVVYAPVPDLLYCAHRALGALKLEGFARRFPRPPATLRALIQAAARLPRRESLDLSPGRRHPVIRVIASRSHRGPDFEAYLERLRAEHAERIELQILGSALKSCVVAEGRADLYPRFGRTMEWDLAAPHAVLRAVGRRIAAMAAGGEPHEAELVYNKPDLANPSFLAY